MQVQRIKEVYQKRKVLLDTLTKANDVLGEFCKLEEDCNIEGFAAKNYLAVEEVYLENLLELRCANFQENGNNARALGKDELSEFLGESPIEKLNNLSIFKDNGNRDLPTNTIGI